jgi:hypothetical protein
VFRAQTQLFRALHRALGALTVAGLPEELRPLTADAGGFTSHARGDQRVDGLLKALACRVEANERRLCERVCKPQDPLLGGRIG